MTSGRLNLKKKCRVKIFLVSSHNYFKSGNFYKISTPFALVGYEINYRQLSVTHLVTTLAIYYLISNTSSWNESFISQVCNFTIKSTLTKRKNTTLHLNLRLLGPSWLNSRCSDVCFLFLVQLTKLTWSSGIQTILRNVETQFCCVKLVQSTSSR